MSVIIQNEQHVSPIPFNTNVQSPRFVVRSNNGKDNKQIVPNHPTETWNVNEVMEVVLSTRVVMISYLFFYTV